MKANARGWAKLALVNELEEFRIFLVNAKNLVGMPGFSFGKRNCAALAAQLGHAAQDRHAVRAAAVPSEALQEQAGYFGRNPMLEPLGFFVRAGPFESDNVRQKLFSEAVAKHKVLRDFPALRAELNVSVAARRADSRRSPCA